MKSKTIRKLTGPFVTEVCINTWRGEPDAEVIIQTVGSTTSLITFTLEELDFLIQALNKAVVDINKSIK